MKNSCVIFLSAMACLTCSPAKAQLEFSFTSNVGNGSFVLNTNNLVMLGSGDGATEYHDVLDSFSFREDPYTNSVTTSNVAFSVFNNSFLVSLRDGFQILMDPANPGGSSAAGLEIDVSGNNSVVNGTTVADLVKVLSSFSEMQSNATFGATVLYNQPHPPYQQIYGTVTSFKLNSPVAISNAKVQAGGFGFDITGGSGSTAVVEVCTMMATNLTWLPVQTNTLTNGFWFFIDPTWTNSTQRFYRVQIPRN